MTNAALELIGRTFGLVVEADSTVESQQDQLHSFISRRIADIIDREFARLPHLLYQVDVPETAVNEAFESANDASEIPSLLADLVISRALEIERAHAAYSSSQEAG